jgi:hypothetical protein
MVLGIDLPNHAEGAYLNIRGALTQHSFYRDAIIGLNLISSLCLRRLFSLAPTEKPISAAQEYFDLIILPTPHRTNNPIAHDYPLCLIKPKTARGNLSPNAPAQRKYVRARYFTLFLEVDGILRDSKFSDGMVAS